MYPDFVTIRFHPVAELDEVAVVGLGGAEIRIIAINTSRSRRRTLKLSYLLESWGGVPLISVHSEGQKLKIFAQET